MSYSDIILAESSLVSYWKLNESHGSIAIDSKDSNNGTCFGNFILNQLLTSSYVNGEQNVNNTYDINPIDTRFNIKNLNTSILFDGKSSYISVNDASNLHLSNVTMEAWINTKSLSRQVIFSKYSIAGWGLNVNNKNLEIYYGESVWLTIGVINSGWNYVVITISNDGVIKVYLNGIYIYTNTLTVNLLNTAKLFIGSSSNNSNYFNGYLMHCAIYNNILSQKQVIQHWLGAVRTDFLDIIENDANLISSYRFAEQCNSDFPLTGNIVLDSQDLNNGTYITPFISFMEGVNLNGGGIIIPNSSSINTLILLTIELVIENITSQPFYFLSKHASSDGFAFYITSKGISIWTGIQYVYSGTIYPFKYLALTYDGGNLLLYTDGFQQPLFDQDGYSISYPITIDYSNTQNIVIGNPVYNINVNHFAIYNAALDSETILQHYVKYKGLTKYQKFILNETNLIHFWPLRTENQFCRTISVFGYNTFNQSGNYFTCTSDYNYNHTLNFIAEYNTSIFPANNLLTSNQIIALYGDGFPTNFTAFTIEVWVYLHLNPIITKFTILGTNYFVSNSQVLISTFLNNGGYKIGIINNTFQFFNGAIWIDSGIIVIKNIVYYLTVTVDSTINFYINGILKKSVSYPYLLVDIDSAFTMLDSSMSPVSIWSLAIYNDILTINQIQNHYNIGIINQTEIDPNNSNIQKNYVPDTIPPSIVIIPPLNLTPYETIILNETSLVSYWIMNETSGFIIKDSKDNNSGIFLNNILFNGNQQGNGNLEPSIQFKGDGNYFIINDNVDNLHFIKISIECWFKTSSLNRQTIISKFNIDPSFFGFSIIMNKGFIEIYNGIDSNNAANTYINTYNNAINSGKTVSQAKALAQTDSYNVFLPNYNKNVNSVYNDNNWHHLVVTINDDGVNNLYIDGLLIYNFNLEPGLLSVSSIYIGADSFSSDNVSLGYFTGYLMNIAVYNDIITIDQVQNHYNIGISTITPLPLIQIPIYIQLILNESSLVSYWKLDETSGTIIHDFQSSNNGILIGNYALNNLGYQAIGPSINLFGGYINILDSITLHSFTELTIECWIKFNITTSSKKVFFSKSGSNGFSLFINNHTLQFFSGINTFDCNTIIDDNFWHYIVATIDVTGLVTLYIDGKKKGFTQTTVNINDLSDNLVLGANSSGGQNSLCNMMHCAIYNKALNFNSILNHYNIGITGNTNFPPIQNLNLNIKETLNLIQYINQNINHGGGLFNYSSYDTLNLIQALNPSHIVLSPIISNNSYSQLILSEISLISYWKFDEPSGPTAFDYKDNNDGTYTEQYIIFNLPGNGILEPCTFFRGISGDYLEVVDAGNLNALINLTIECWVKIAFIGEQTIIISKYNPLTFTGYALRLNANNNFDFYAGDGLTWFSSNSSVTDNKWHYLAMTISSSGDIKTYFDGILTNSDTGYAVDLTNNGYPLRFSDPETGNILIPGNTPNFSFTGRIMHVAIYNSVLNVETILNHYTYGTIISKQEEYVFLEQSGEIN